MGVVLRLRQSNRRALSDVLVVDRYRVQDPTALIPRQAPYSVLAANGFFRSCASTATGDPRTPSQWCRFSPVRRSPTYTATPKVTIGSKRCNYVRRTSPHASRRRGLTPCKYPDKERASEGVGGEMRWGHFLSSRAQRPRTGRGGLRPTPMARDTRLRGGG